MTPKHFWKVLVVAFACAGLGTQAFSQEYCLSGAKFDEFLVESDKWENALRDRRFADLDAHFNRLAGAYERGEISDDVAGRWFRIFDRESPALEPLHQEWIQKYPTSFAAQLAAANYFHTIGHAKRGTKFRKDTSESQFQAMEASFKTAFSHLDRAEKLTAKPTLAIAKRLSMMTSIGGRSEVVALYKEGERADPNNTRVKAAYISGSNPKWGGSTEALDEMVRLTRASKLNFGIKSFVEYLVIDELADMAWREKDYGNAISLYERAHRLCPGFEETLVNLLRLYNSQKNYTGTVGAADRYIKRRPDKGWGYSRRALANYHLSNLKQAMADAEKASALGDGYGAYLLGWFYDKGKSSVVTRDARRALELYTIALSRGYDNARADVERLSVELRK